MTIYLSLIWEFIKTGLFAIGGGLAALPFITDIGQRTGWYTTSDIANMIAVAESCPGPLGVNMATYAGYLTTGVLGGVTAVIAFTIPAIFIISAIYSVLNKFRTSQAVARIFYGLRPASTDLIEAAEIGVVKVALLHMDTFKATGSIASLFNWKCIILAAVVYYTLVKFKKHPFFYIIASAAAGIAFGL